MPKMVCIPFLTAVATACGGNTSTPSRAAPDAAPITCATGATPDVSVVKLSPAFVTDTGDPSGIGATYGQPSCKDWYVAEVDLTGADVRGRDLFVTASWSDRVPAMPCTEKASLTVFGFDGSSWSLFDYVTFVGQPSGSVCHAQATSHWRDPSSMVGGTVIPASAGLRRVRFVVNATDGTQKVPINLQGQPQ